MIGSIFSKIIGKQINQAASSGGSSLAFTILFLLGFVLLMIGLSIWFFCACHGWLVLVYPAFAAFPRWAFVLLMFIFCNKGSSSSSS